MADLKATSFASRDQLLDQIKHERVMELASECLRWPDLDRWGDLYTQQGINEIASRDADSRHSHLASQTFSPIPQREDRLLSGSDSESKILISLSV